MVGGRSLISSDAIARRVVVNNPADRRRIQNRRFPPRQTTGGNPQVNRPSACWVGGFSEPCISGNGSGRSFQPWPRNVPNPILGIRS